MTGLVEIIINAVFTGFGTAIGSYFATKYALTHLEKKEGALKKIKDWYEGLWKGKP